MNDFVVFQKIMYILPRNTYLHLYLIFFLDGRQLVTERAVSYTIV